MAYLLNALYFFVVLFVSPWLLYKSLTTGKYRRGLWAKCTGSALRRDALTPCVWFHGVSVGEIHLLQPVVKAFRQRHPDWQVVISTTTDTGFDEAKKKYPDLCVFFWPFDFTWAVRRALHDVLPSLVVLAEGEVWPNFLAEAAKQSVPVAMINGRMSPRSLHRYQKLGTLPRTVFAQLSLCAMQNEEYAANVRSLGADSRKVIVTGSVKYDGACCDRDNPKTLELGRLLNVAADDRIWIAGSTQAPEEQIVLDIFRRAREVHSNLRLFLVPRHKERFDEVASLLQRSGLPFARRSALTKPLTNRQAIVLGDTMGELGALWGLADVAFVGGSLDGQRGGQNMIDPAAYGAAVLFGPHVWNFKEPVARLLEHDAAIQVQDASELEREVLRLLASAGARRQLGMAARQFVLSQQGATAKTVEALDLLICQSRSQTTKDVQRPQLALRAG